MFPAPPNGTLSGFEKFFWTNAADCTTTTTSTVYGGTFNVDGNGNITTTNVTLLHAVASVYYMCYEDSGVGGATYAYYSTCILNVSGSDCLFSFFVLFFLLWFTLMFAGKFYILMVM